jgi:cytochrome P450 family 4
MLQVILSSYKNTEKIYFYKLLHNFLGQGLITSSGKFRGKFLPVLHSFWRTRPHAFSRAYKTFNYGFFFFPGQKWRQHRRLLQPIFHLSVLEGFIGTFHDSARLLVEKLNTETDLSSVNITAPINKCVLNILHGEHKGRSRCVLCTTGRKNISSNSEVSVFSSDR